MFRKNRLWPKKLILCAVISTNTRYSTFLGAELLYDSVCHNVPMFVRRPFTKKITQPLIYLNSQSPEPFFLPDCFAFICLSKQCNLHLMISSYDRIVGLGFQQTRIKRSIKSVVCMLCFYTVTNKDRDGDILVIEKLYF